MLKEIKICPLCEQKVQDFQSNSHIIPEWMYKESKIYDNKGRCIALDLKQKKRNFYQNGSKGKFFCTNCEKNTSILDNYASQIFKTHTKPMKNVIVEQRKTPDGLLFQQWSGFDFKKMQQFIYSICLREHFYRISKSEKKLIAPDKHLFNILRLYKTDDMDYLSYPIVIVRYNESMYANIVERPYVDKHEGHHVILFKAGGFQFFIKVSSHSSSFFDKKLILKPPGQIIVCQKKYEEMNLWKARHYQLNQFIMEWKNNDNPSCP